MGQAFSIMNKPSRRKFIQMGSLMGLGAALMPMQFCSPAKKEGETLMTDPETVAQTLKAFGIQLYSVKDQMAENPQETMRALASYGYKQFEGFDGGKGILWGMETAEFKSLNSEIGVDFVATHCDVFKNLEAQAEQAAEVGIKYLICPWIGGQDSLDKYKAIAEQFNQIGETLKGYGLKFAYHNHDYTFVEQEGQLPQDVLMDNTDPALVDFEMDIYWVYVAGVDPEAYMKKYKDRFRLCHVKDAAAGIENPHERGVLLGQGEIPFAKLIKESQSLGMKYYIVEQEQFDGVTPMQAAEKNAAYLSKLEY
ncbi:sugar phosphate isomerase/epimerase [Algoriphagus zhangzhouensis]|uniref:Sugar phosphate isomerase/epimerase n=2 Tax=Algoriphagus zhangzhouensis TaxID=1073327 RepID=A0A1M7Z8K8_9BACT|nr:sugar phosphate isomerase/epimerase [Algoriphagus zhangzhouensis]SHO61251.1 Sugar phosphate isomerase/epimerase [Algoriphagus zhangzhouensis]